MDPEVEDFPGALHVGLGPSLPRRTAPAVGSSGFSLPGARSPRRARSKQETESFSLAAKSSSLAGAGGEGSGVFPQLCIEPGRAKRSKLCV